MYLKKNYVKLKITVKVFKLNKYIGHFYPDNGVLFRGARLAKNKNNLTITSMLIT